MCITTRNIPSKAPFTNPNTQKFNMLKNIQFKTLQAANIVTSGTSTPKTELGETRSMYSPTLRLNSLFSQPNHKKDVSKNNTLPSISDHIDP